MVDENSSYIYILCIHTFVFGPVPINDMQEPPLKSGHVGIKDILFAETYEETIFRFSVLKIWSILYSIFVMNWGLG